MNPAVFLAFPDLRCSLLLLVSEGRNDRPFDRRADGGRPSPRGNTSAPTPAFLSFSSVARSSPSAAAFTLGIRPSAFQARGPRGLRNRGRRLGPIDGRVSPGERLRGRVPAGLAPPVAGVRRLSRARGLLERAVARIASGGGQPDAVPSHHLLSDAGRPAVAGVVRISPRSPEPVPGLAGLSVVA